MYWWTFIFSRKSSATKQGNHDSVHYTLRLAHKKIYFCMSWLWYLWCQNFFGAPLPVGFIGIKMNELWNQNNCECSLACWLQEKINMVFSLVWYLQSMNFKLLNYFLLDSKALIWNFLDVAISVSLSLTLEFTKFV